MNMYAKRTVAKQLKQIFKGNVLQNEPLKNHTSFRIGGNADFLVSATTLEQVVLTVILCKEHKVPLFVLGNGTNVLAADEGYQGIVLKLNQLEGIEEDEETGQLKVWAGTSLSSLVTYANNRGLGGMSDGYGIPGTVGGAIKMNASAYNYETSLVVAGVLALVDGKITYLYPPDLQFGYRTSMFQTNKSAICLRADFLLTPNQSVQELTARSAEIMTKRKTNQPLEFPSAGSVFKRLDGIIVSKKIDEAGLKGFCVGGAEVSTKHAGFIVNKGNATCSDVLAVINYVKKEVFAQFGLQLEEEIVQLKN